MIIFKFHVNSIKLLIHQKALELCGKALIKQKAEKWSDYY